MYDSERLRAELSRAEAIVNARRYGHDPGPWRAGTKREGEWFAGCQHTGCKVLIAVRMWDEPPFALFSQVEGRYECPVTQQMIDNQGRTDG
jgi:hypothetical protein